MGGFKNWRCGAWPSACGSIRALNLDLQGGCIRKAGHDGLHRTRWWEWETGEEPTRRKDKADA